MRCPPAMLCCVESMDQDNLYRLLFDRIRIVTRDNGHSQLPRFARLLRWSSPLGCVIQACDENIVTPLRSSCLTKPSLFISAVLSADWQYGEPYCNMTDARCASGTLLVSAIREPVIWLGETPRCDRLRVTGIGIPKAALEALGLGEEFNDLFDDPGAPVAVKVMPLPPRIRSLAEEMLSAPISGKLGGLLADAHAAEIVARTMASMVTGEEVDAVNPRDRKLLRRVRDLLESDLSRAWTLADLARMSGVGARSLNTKFRAAFGVPVFEYLKRRRLEFARETLLRRQLSVSEIAYRVGYDNPANFATAFRRYFGHAPSALRRTRRAGHRCR